MRRVLGFAVATLAAVAMLTGCTAGDDAGPEKAKVLYFNYDGAPIECVAWRGSHGEIGLTCDFVEYHNGTVAVPDDVDVEEADVVYREYQGETLTCLSWRGSHAEEGLTCDFVDFHQAR